ncbi:putative histamine-releasing factor [Toxoplasma gondii TgCatPRC2]|uniref:Histamine-releasing factor, putative n=15 Tax=Toxoplasma gondii TaxID=5811 RepID=A0A125YGX4_TOXGM|nr:histamine-releasing factor, putative [Toxoplasma gondii ME49]EPR63282.1 putative histamine-releasing factor [Toxoplasma gondii GT1]ESS34565.1 putative histamine-releasing factor [Toxoplasma gondii VEG]KAF4638846.1 putative histamine-releasing factor [Toxoplasma gondii]KFG29088.1 putative histamine-releasing factor [Toxoplasma gondii p89]KFG34748.1 putative histamine-releasing factor [Toxoplasma gondii GAB2-2007-GAL-DOM2]KFG46392.1 putative histamine-releasing factor [Toxoplasma gondii FOU]|eukprot:XP_008888299.1 histamine-releasing factor, putative [Hammondia hammondi]
MKVYKDVFTGDELCSDSYAELPPMDDPSLSEVAFEVATKRIVKGAEDYGIADNSEEDGGGVDSTSETVVDVVDAFRLQETPFSKKEFGTYIKGYMQRVKGHLEKNHPDRVDKFMSGAQALVKKILGQFDDFQFFLGESADCEAGVVFAYYKDGEEAPRLIYIRDGLKEEKY